MHTDLDRRFPANALGALAAVLSLASATAAGGHVADAERQIIVAPAGGAQAANALSAALAAEGLTVVDRDTVSGALLVAPPDDARGAWLAALGARGDVAYAEPNSTGQGGLTPNDSFYASQWHLNSFNDADIDAPEAWDITTGSADITVAVLDTGVDSDHPDLVGRIAPGGADFVNEDPNPEADHPHGTWCIGMIAANADNAFAAAGIDWRCQVLPVKVLDQNNRGTTFDLAQGINFCATRPEVDILSLSLINYPGSSTLLSALQNARNNGKILIACAGNGGIGNANTSFPGADFRTISVGATTSVGTRASFSGTGAPLDFVAPGASVRTIAHNTSADTTSVVSGCSFATPLTAGVVSLLLARAEELGLGRLTQDEVYDLLRDTADDGVGSPAEDTPGYDQFHGHGRVNAAAALAAITPPACPGDANGDGATDLDDFSLLAVQFGQAVTPGSGADFDASGVVDLDDFSILAISFGCETTR